MNTESEDSSPFYSDETVRKALNVFADMSQILKSSAFALQTFDRQKYALPFTILYSAFGTTAPLIVLQGYDFKRAAVIHGRITFETLLNGTFLLIDNPEQEDLAAAHAFQKVFRVATKSYFFKSIGRVIGSAPGTIISPPDLIKPAYDPFTSKKGREITVWTPETISMRINAIEEWLRPGIGDCFRGYYESLYSIASEMAHGTFYSLCYWDGANLAKGTKITNEELERFQNGICTQNLTLLSLLMWASIEGMAKILGDETYLLKAKLLVENDLKPYVRPK